MTSEGDALVQAFIDYVQAFQTLDPAAVVAYCDVPCVMITRETTLVMATPAATEALFARLMDGLRARGYARSELTDLRVKQVADGLAFVSVSRARYRTDGTEMERLGETYTLRLTGQGWKIAAAVVHAPGLALTASTIAA